MICIGELNQRLELQDLVRTPDGAGGSDTNWTTIATVWAKLRPRHGREQLWAEAKTATNTHVITIRYRTGVSAQMRFAGQGRTFDIVSVINIDEQNRWLSCLCKEQPAC